MNDVKDRFREREVKVTAGYTSVTHRWTFIGTNDDEFDTTFVHEIFHALNIFYGTVDDREEELAEKFTQELGLGK
jgi:hypothetical protein